MLHTKFRGNRPTAKEKKILERFLPYGGVAAILVMSSDFHFLVPVSFHI